MENKLQQLTEKLLSEGLEKGREQAEQLVSDANSQAKKIIAEAQAKAQQIVDSATAAADELRRNTANEVRLASTQTISALRSQIEKMVVASVVEPHVSAAWADSSFVKNLIVEAVRRWDPSSENPIQVIVPQEAIADVNGAVASLLSGGVEVVYDGKVRVPFRIAPADGGYYVSFSDEDFATLIKSALRPKVVELIYGAQ